MHKRGGFASFDRDCIYTLGVTHVLATVQLQIKLLRRVFMLCVSLDAPNRQSYCSYTVIKQHKKMLYSACPLFCYLFAVTFSQKSTDVVSMVNPVIINVNVEPGLKNREWLFLS